mmetsp:Transcript_24196/g.45883  ORF Transcript_24196/g.45883 Transcript_24196/m.45883 type:complete len:132 (-) Transcript_24196:34-429(-)
MPVECPGGVAPLEPSLVFGIGTGLFTMLLVGSLSIVICLGLSCQQGPCCGIFFANVALFLLLLALPKEGPCPRKPETEEVNRHGQLLDITLAIAAICAVAALGLFSAEFLIKKVTAVPRDERLTGHRTARR